VDPAQKDPIVKKDAKETKMVTDGPTARTEEKGRPKPTSSKDERSTNDILEELLGKAGK
jgi:hypothetical protein